ncbi:uncharacterized protein BDZ99DRAFT_476335 [Mytilinidion resinicola]|uniref:Uncharacterized protein n=1 Tax=Mytilinidion resinicola TaxID=574789 RepID=A0A6A6YNL8_9PEZI|nr:uncharacterized protein BDZ99DRAFT_476335 [Mytilinidion resinicola]KAF2810128.1 hypothetical protein BDZ99DRAFT_476335 [Mytilinidion resinicola]
MTYQIYAACATVLASTHSPTDCCPHERRLLFNTKCSSGIPRSSFGKLKRKTASMLQKCVPSSPHAHTSPSHTRNGPTRRRSGNSIAEDWIGESPISSTCSLARAPPDSKRARKDVPAHGLEASPTGAGFQMHSHSPTDTTKRHSISRATHSGDVKRSRSGDEDESWHPVGFARPGAPKVRWEPAVLVGPPVREVQMNFRIETKRSERKERKRFTDLYSSESDDEEEGEGEGEEIRSPRKKQPSIGAEIKRAMRDTWTKMEELGA